MSLPSSSHWLWPEWRPHPRVRTVVTTRHGSHSPIPWQGFNLGDHCGDDAARVALARSHVHEQLATSDAPAWMHQVHGCHIVEASPRVQEADGIWTYHSKKPCAVLTADCLPVLLARHDGSAVGAFHAGWQGLHRGILGKAVRLLAPEKEPLAAWLGPAICQDCYQVDEPFYQRFLALDPAVDAAFVRDLTPGHWRCSLQMLAQHQLHAAGVFDIDSANLCTVTDASRFYSYRRDGVTGRFATLIWLE